MAKRYGGKFSPDATGSQPEENAFRGQTVAPRSSRARLLYVLPLPLLIGGLLDLGEPVSMAAKLLAFALLMSAAWLLSEGIRAQAAYDARKVARPPAVPRKLFAAFLSGAGVALAGYSGGLDFGLFGSLLTGAIAAFAHVLAFGLDPMARKGMEGVSDAETERVAKAVERAEGIVAQLIDASKRIGNRSLEARVERLATAARDVFRVVEEDPRDLARARKFMTVYLSGARDATARFADVYQRSQDADARVQYEALLDDLEASFRAHRQELLSDNRTALEVEIEVLQERLAREGIRAG